MYSLGISLHRLPGQPVTMTRSETWTSAAPTCWANRAKWKLRDKLKAAAMDRTDTLHEGKKYINCGVES